MCCSRRSSWLVLGVCASIGDRVAALVPDGATLQLGIGAVPDAVLAALCLRRDLKVWSEMFSDGMLALEKAGALEPGHLITCIFAFGSAELYDWMDRNPSIRDDADRDDQRPGADRPPATDGVRQHRAPGGPVRAGEREPGPPRDLLRLRRAARFRGRRAALTGRPGHHHAAVL